MISAIVFVPDRTRPGPPNGRDVLVRSLVWLVSAVVAGVIHDVTVAGRDALALDDIGDQTGCNIVQGQREADRLAAACAVAKHARLLMIESAFQPADGIVGELDMFSRIAAQDSSTRLMAAPASAWERIFPDRARTIGLLAPTARCRALAGRDFHGLEAVLKPKTRFATRAHPIF